MLQQLREKNPGLSLYGVDSPAFTRYGRVVRGRDFSGLLAAMGRTPLPETGNVYVAGDAGLQATADAAALREADFGGQPIEVGYCNGHNTKMNALEYHKSAEIDIAATDLILLLGDARDIHNNLYEAKNLEAFFVPAGTACELYSTTLHFSPCKVRAQGFKCVIVLPEGTNLPLAGRPAPQNDEEALLFMRNKWLIAHADSLQAREKGALAGIRGENIEVRY